MNGQLIIFCLRIDTNVITIILPSSDIVNFNMQVVPLQQVQKAIQNVLQNQSCITFHQGFTCNNKSLQQFSTSFKSCFKMYLAVHLLPLLLFKRKKLKRSPKKELLKFVLEFLRSMMFAAGYAALVRRVICAVCQLHQFHGYSNAVAGVLASVTLCFQPIGRQSEIALYCFNKSAEVAYMLAKRRNYPVKLPMGENLMMAVSLGAICYHYLNNPEVIRGSYAKILDKILLNI